MEDDASLMTQQVAEQVKTPVIQNSHALVNPAFRPSPWPTVLSTTSKVLYGLGGLSVIASVGIWNRISMPARTPKGKKVATVKPTREQYQESQRLGTFVGLLAPTFVIAAKALDDASTKLTNREMNRWEKQQAGKARSFRFFGR